jgi:hypothetical protein
LAIYFLHENMQSAPAVGGRVDAIDLAEIDTLPVAISSSAMLIPSGGRVMP